MFFNAERREKKAIFSLLILALIWGYNWVMMKIALQSASPFQFAALRAALGAVSLFVLLICLGKPLTLKAAWGTFWVGVLQNGALMGLVSWALVAGGAGKTAILNYTMPLWVLLLASLLLGERLRPIQWVGLIGAVTGLIFLLTPLSFTAQGSSKVIALTAGFVWAVSTIIAKKVEQNHSLDLLSFTAWQMLFGSLPLVALGWLIPSPPVEWTGTFIVALSYNVIPATAIAWLLWLYALKNLPAGTAAVGSLLTPVIGVLAASLQLGEIPSFNELMGMILIVIALCLNTLSSLMKQSNDR